MKVVLHYITLIHYRQTLFELLFEDEELEFYVVCGRSSPLSNIRSFVVKNKFTERVKFIRNIGIGKKKFLWQHGIIKATAKINPEVIILLGVSPAILSSLFSFFYFKLFSKARLFWWGHGTLGKQGRIGKIFRRPFYSLADGVLLYGEVGKRILHESYGISPEKLPVIHNCLEQTAYGNSVENITVAKEQKCLQVLYSGRLVDYKKIPLLIHAVEILSRNEGSVHLTVLGDGPELDQLKELTKTLNLTQVVSFPGGQYGEGARPYFQKADLLVLPSAAGLSIIHALSYGLPVITSDEMKRHGPEIEALTPEANGSFFEKDNVVDLSEKLANWGMRLQNSRTEIAEQCMSSIGDYRPENVYLKFKDAIKSR